MFLEKNHKRHPWTLKFLSRHHDSLLSPHQKLTQDEQPYYSQRLCPIFPWRHPPWPQITVSQLPLRPLQAPCAQVCAHCSWFPCLGRRNGAHRNIERWVEHRSWMAAAQWIDATTNQTMILVVWGALESRFGWAEHMREEV